MKSAITILFLLLATINFAQSQNVNTLEPIRVTRVSDFKISVTVNSTENLESTFKMTDIKEVLNEVGDNEKLTFEIICEGTQTTNEEKSKVSYRVKGNSDDLKGFLKIIKKVRKGAINYYKNKQ